VKATTDSMHFGKKTPIGLQVTSAHVSSFSAKKSAESRSSANVISRLLSVIATFSGYRLPFFLDIQVRWFAY
jgi:hypothetical protein